MAVLSGMFGGFGPVVRGRQRLVRDRIQRTGVHPSYGGAAPRRAPTPKTAWQVHSGHSLTDDLFQNSGERYGGMMPVMFEERGTVPGRIGNSTIPGSNTQFRWNSPPDPGRDDSARYNIDRFDLLSITEGGWLALPYTEAQYTNEQLAIDVDYLGRFIQNARLNGRGGAGAETFLYTMWPALDGSGETPAGNFREQLERYEEGWHYRQEKINAQFGGYLYIIPGHRVLMRIYDDIQLGLVPGVTDISQIGDDNIHLNALGALGVVSLHYAVIFQESPVGISYDWIVAPTITAAQALYMQTIAWEIANEYARAGMGGSDMGIVGIRPPAPLEHPRVTLGDRARVVFDARGPMHESTAAGDSTPAVIGGRVGKVLDGDNTYAAATPALRPLLADGFVRFASDSVMRSLGAVNLSGHRYVAQFVRVNGVTNYPENTWALGVNDVTWTGPHMMENHGAGSTFVGANTDMSSRSFNIDVGTWYLMERWWDDAGMHFYAEGLITEGLVAKTDQVFPTTTKISVGGALDDGAWPTGVFKRANVDVAGLVIAQGVLTTDERARVRRWLNEMRPKEAVRGLNIKFADSILNGTADVVSTPNTGELGASANLTAGVAGMKLDPTGRALRNNTTPAEFMTFAAPVPVLNRRVFIVMARRNYAQPFLLGGRLADETVGSVRIMNVTAPNGASVANMMLRMGAYPNASSGLFPRTQDVALYEFELLPASWRAWYNGAAAFQPAEVPSPGVEVNLTHLGQDTGGSSPNIAADIYAMRSITADATATEIDAIRTALATEYAITLAATPWNYAA